MRKFKPIINCMLIMMITAFILSGCKFFSSTKLKKPVVTLNETNTTLTWDVDYNALKYEIYMNESKVDEVESDSDKTQCSYNYSLVVKEYGECRFQVKSIAKEDYVDSDLSDAVVVTVGSATKYLNKNLSDIKYSYAAQYAPYNINVNNNKITWSRPQSGSNLTGYVVSIYTNSLGVDNYTTSSTSLDIADSMKCGNEILVIKVSAVIGGVNYSSKDLYYYNPIDDDKYGEYTDTIYTFDGEVYDYYIENWTELQNLYYYAFIYRLEDIDFMVSRSFYNEYSDSYFDTSSLNNYKADDYILEYAYYETYAFNAIPHLRDISSPSGVDDRCFNLTCKFMSKECSITGIGASVATYSQDERYEPYYNMVNYERRSETYDKFASDSFYLATEVSTSEELFWAVGSHVKPIITDTNSRAYLIYEEAKNVLREIVCDDMTDYEKVLSIFDYIMTTTTYDYNAYNNGAHNPMQYACYYLEAVFLSPNNVSVCDGYSKAFTLLCNMEGINAVRVVGTAGGTTQGGHAWNKVEIDNNWYVVDITWTEMEGNSDGVTHYAKSYDFLNDIYYAEAYLNIDEEESCHAYFLLSDEDIKNTHNDFDNRFVYSIIKAPVSYDYYTAEFVTAAGKEVSRYVNSIEDISAILEHCLMLDGSGVEMVIDTDLFYMYGNDIIEILIDARYSFCSVSYFTNLVESSTIRPTQTGVKVGEETLYYVKGMSYAGFKYDSEGNIGIYVIVCPGVSLTTTQRLSDYIDFVITSQIEKSSNICLSKNKIDEWVTAITGNSNPSSYTDTQRIEYVEQYFENLFTAKGSNITVELTRTSNDITEELYTQDEDGQWKEMELTTGEFTIQFTYA